MTCHPLSASLVPFTWSWSGQRSGPVGWNSPNSQLMRRPELSARSGVPSKLQPSSNARPLGLVAWACPRARWCATASLPPCSMYLGGGASRGAALGKFPTSGPTPRPRSSAMGADCSAPSSSPMWPTSPTVSSLPFLDRRSWCEGDRHFLTCAPALWRPGTQHLGVVCHKRQSPMRTKSRLASQLGPWSCPFPFRQHLFLQLRSDSCCDLVLGGGIWSRPCLTETCAFVQLFCLCSLVAFVCLHVHDLEEGYLP